MLRKNKILWAIMAGCVMLLATACNILDGSTDSAAEITEPQVAIDLPEILERGKLIALTGYDVTSYFIYRGRPMGFEYDLLSRFANYIGVELEIVVVRDLDLLFDELNKGTGDLLAYNLTITKERKQYAAFTDYHTAIRQMLVQRLPENWRNMPQYKIDQELIESPLELIGKRVHVRKRSSYYQRLHNLSEEIGGDVEIIEVPGDVTTEELIRQVSEGEIEYSIADENIAWINKTYYDNIDIRVAVSLPQRIAWSVRKNSPALRETINEWLAEIKQEPTFNVIYNKYYRNRNFYRQRVSSNFSSFSGGQISPYDDLIKKYASGIGWDWRLLASQIYEESRFDPKAKSWAGAVGLMQITPQTAEQYNLANITHPEENLRAGTAYLAWLSNFWSEIPDSSERLRFVLASFNVGQGHVRDAQRLAEKFGGDRLSWSDVSAYLLKKSQPKYYNDPVVLHGYCRGAEPVDYVKEILYIYENYRRFS